jgi:hypothetical protein
MCVQVPAYLVFSLTLTLKEEAAEGVQRTLGHLPVPSPAAGPPDLSPTEPYRAL